MLLRSVGPASLVLNQPLQTDGEDMGLPNAVKNICIFLTLVWAAAADFIG